MAEGGWEVGPSEAYIEIAIVRITCLVLVSKKVFTLVEARHSTEEHQIRFGVLVDEACGTTSGDATLILLTVLCD